MKVAFIAATGSLGGAERCMLDIIVALRSIAPSLEAHGVLLDDGPLVDALTAVGVRVHLAPLPASVAALGERARSLASLRAAPGALAAAAAVARHALRLRRLLRQLRPDIVHSHGAKGHLLAIACRPAGAAVVWHLHDFLGARPTSARLLRLASRRATLAIAVSRAVADDASAALPDLPVRVVHDAVDTERFSPTGAAADLDALAGLERGVTPVARVGLVAGYGRWKGHDVFLRAAREVLARAVVPTRFYVIGGPIYRTSGSQFSREELSNLAGRLGLEAVVGFVPFQTDTAPIYRALDVVVHASTSPEPFGLTVAEALACGRAVVATTCCGALELLDGEAVALTTPPGDPCSLATATGRLIEDAELRRALGGRGRSFAEAHLSRDRLGPQVLACYERALSEFRRSDR